MVGNETLLEIIKIFGDAIVQRDADYEQQKRSAELRRNSIDVEFKVKE